MIHHHLLLYHYQADIYRRIREAGLDPMPLVFRVPREEDLQSIFRFLSRGGDSGAKGLI